MPHSMSDTAVAYRLEVAGQAAERIRRRPGWRRRLSLRRVALVETYADPATVRPTAAAAVELVEEVR